MDENNNSIPDKGIFAELNSKEMAFVCAILEGKTAAEAYVVAYPTAAKWKRTSVYPKASLLRNSPKIVESIATARAAGAGDAKASLQGHLLELERLKQIALSQNNIGAAIQAEQLRGKAAGLYIEKHETVTTPDPRATLSKIAETNPQLAADLAKAKGIEWTTTANKN